MMFSPEQFEHAMKLQTDEHLGYMKQQAAKSLEEKIDEDYLRSGNETEFLIKLITPSMTEFFKKKQKDADNNNDANEEEEEKKKGGILAFPAVDLASGRAVGTIQLALGLRHPLFEPGDLYFHPSEYAGHHKDYSPKRSLQCQIESDVKASEILFEDEKGAPIYRKDLVELDKLKATQYNGRRGILHDADPKDPGRFGVQLSSDPKDKKSFKAQNVFYAGCPTFEKVCMRALRLEHQSANAFFKDLLNRVREIDVLKHDTWSNVDDLMGTCALLTCMNFMCCLGYREPTAWHNVLELGNKLLQVGGCIAQYDCIKFGGFGDVSIMKTYVEEKGLKLELVTTKFANQNFIGIIWRKV